MFVLSLVFAVASASPSTIGTCYSNAETANPGRTVLLKNGGTTLVATSSLAVAFDAVAQFHHLPGLTVVANAAGNSALSQAMNCLLANDVVTLSTIWTNEHVPSASVRPDTVRFVSGGAVVDVLEFERVHVVGGQTFLEHRSSTTSDCLQVRGTSYGHDFFSALSSADKGTFTRCDGRQCEGSCSGGGQSLCSCTGGGVGCISITQNPVTGGPGSVIVIGV